MNHKDEKVTLFNNVFCAFIINQGFSLFGYSFGRKTALYSILNCSSHLKVCTSNTSTLPFLWAGRVIGMAVDSNALALLCLQAFNVMSPEAWAAPDGKWLTPSQGDFSRAFQKHTHNCHDFFYPHNISRAHACTQIEMLKYIDLNSHARFTDWFESTI